MRSFASTATTERVLPWLPLAIGPPLVLLTIPADWPRWLVMWLLAGAVFLACKWLSWTHSALPASSAGRRAAYWLAWPGLNAATFLRAGGLPRNGRARPLVVECCWAAAELLIGAGLFWGAARLLPPDRELLIGWVGMIGLVLMLHFGAFRLLSCLWQSAGVDAPPLMRAPPAATSLSEFWGTRWNTAFRDLAHRHVYRPLVGRLGPRGAALAVFAFSGVVHDLVISLPAGGGYGGPTAYFALQAVGFLGERSKIGRALGLGRGVRGWLFTAILVVAPAGLLFHPPFIREVVLPFMHTAGAK
jgi:Membrane bound O-acyl transferase family